MSAQAQLLARSAGPDRGSLGVRLRRRADTSAGVLALARRLLRRGEARPDAAVHGVGVRDLAAGRARHRRALPLGPALVARASSSRELVVNGELLLDDHRRCRWGACVGQQAGNMAEIIVGALLLRRLIGPRAALDRVEQVGGMLVALAVATAISATVGTVSMLAGGVVDGPRRRRSGARGGSATSRARWSWCPLALAWAGDPARRVAAHAEHGRAALLIAAVATLGALAVSTQRAA